MIKPLSKQLIFVLIWAKHIKGSVYTFTDLYTLAKVNIDWRLDHDTVAQL